MLTELQIRELVKGVVSQGNARLGGVVLIYAIVRGRIRSHR